jgi:aromatic-L-amino-acid/L-tryptophan decarboxylase
MQDTGLEPSRATQESWLRAVGDFALEHMAALEAAPAVGTVGEAGNRIAAEVSVPIPERPLEGGVERALQILARAADASLNTPGPGYLAYIPGGGLYAAALADLLSDCMNRYTGLAAAAPALVRLESDVLAWLASAFGYGAAARGLFTSGGSLANFSAVVTARHAHLGDDGDFRAAVAYTSTQAHHSVRKSLFLAGIPPHNVRAIGVDAGFRMDVEALADAVRADRERGVRPFLVVASAGTTNTGAVDPLSDIAQLCAAEGLWLHVDAAYGGAFVLCEAGRQRLAAIERADSITFDPHKGMFLPYGTGCLLVRNGEQLRRAHAAAADYLQDFDSMDRSAAPPSPTEYGPELSRDYRGLRVWLPLMLHGARAFRDALAEKLVLAERLHAGLQALGAAGAPLEIVAPPQLTVIPFRLRRRDGETLHAWNTRSAALRDRINARQRVYLSGTTLPVADGMAYTLRACVLSFRTHARHVDACIEDVEQALAGDHASH